MLDERPCGNRCGQNCRPGLCTLPVCLLKRDQLPKHGAVWVATTAHPNIVVLTVENIGEKLIPQAVTTLVELFQRGTERIPTDHAGIGLCLVIVKSITQAHDGTLTPLAAGGLCFTVQLPAATEPGRSRSRKVPHDPGRNIKAFGSACRCGVSVTSS